MTSKSDSDYVETECKQKNVTPSKNFGSTCDTTDERGTVSGTSRRQLLRETIELSQVNENQSSNEDIRLTTELTAFKHFREGSHGKKGRQMNY